MQRRIALALALACTFPAAAWADFRAEFDTPEGSGDRALTRIELAGDHMRTDAGNVSMLFDVGSGRLLMLERDKHQYMDMSKVAATAGAVMAQANAAMANLPPEQRAMIQQRMGSVMGEIGAKVDVRVTPTGAGERVAGYACQMYRTRINGVHRADSCLANLADAGISAADQASLRKAFAQLKAMTEKMSSGMFKSPLGEMPADKFPVKITSYDDNGKVEQVVQIKNIANSAVAAGEFAIPAGYTEHEISLGRHP